MDFINQHTIEFIWLGIAIIFAIIEAITLGLTTIWFAGGALVALFAAIFNSPLGVQIGLFILVSGVLIGMTRKVLVNKMKLGNEKTNVDALAGKTAIVVATVRSLEPGRVTIGGQEWAALSSEAQEIFHKGQKVRVTGIKGVTAIVTGIDEGDPLI